jgi:hypothetical protein
VRGSVFIFLFLASCGQAGGFRIDGSFLRPDASELIDTGDEGLGDSGMDAEDGGVVVRDGSSADPSMSFFVTSTGNGANGGNLGGVAGADEKCRLLATAAGVGSKTWRAYLGVSDLVGGSTLTNPRDRIGTGPWNNYYGEPIGADVNSLHSAGIDSTKIFTDLGLAPPLSEHDILTGGDELGMVRTGDTCSNWTDSTDGSPGFVGHWDWSLPDTQGVPSWNSSHRALGCSAATLASSLGTGRFYCFAID